MLPLILFMLLPLAHAEQVPDYDRPYSPIFTDKPAYSWTEKIKITVVAPSWNAGRHVIDDIGGDPEHAITISAGGGRSLSPYRLTETGASTGVFTGEVILTGFSHDADGDGDPDTRPRTIGGGPTNGFLEAGRDSAVTISFEFADGVILTESVPVSWNVGTVRFLEDLYTVGRDATVRVADADMNLNPEGVDRLRIGVFSDSDSAGLEVDATETDPDSGVFEAGILFGSGGESGGNRLFAVPGDTIHATYDDRTLPAPYGIRDHLGISAESLLVSDVLPTERAVFHGVSLFDGLGNAVPGAVANRQVQIGGSITNNQPHDQPFACLIQIKNPDGVVTDLHWISGVLRPDGTADVSGSWTPARPGDHVVESFVWESVPSMAPLSEPSTAKIPVG